MRIRASRAGLMLAVVHAALLGSLAGKLVLDRARYPRAWARTAPFDPSTPIRGRYVRLGLEVPLDSVPGASSYATYGVRLRAANGRVIGALDSAVRSPRVLVQPGDGRVVRLAESIAFFLPEHVPDPSRRASDEELWVEVTLPPCAPPRPIRLGVMRGGALTPLELR